MQKGIEECKLAQSGQRSPTTESAEPICKQIAYEKHLSRSDIVRVFHFASRASDFPPFGGKPNARLLATLSKL